MSDENRKTGFLTDGEGKPSDTRLKSWVLFVCAILIMGFVLFMWGFGNESKSKDFQVPIMFFLVCLGGGISIQFLGKLMETFAIKKLQ